MRGLSVFSGIGGLDLAAEWAGIEPVAFCEIDSYCQKVLKKHWPGVPIFRDVFKLRGYQVGPVDIIYGGFPCQPFSVAGKQKGKSDTRHLWPEFSRLVKEIRPRWVFAENVPGILAIAADDVCADLERLGYEVGVWNFEAAAVGANHRRARIAFVAHTGHELRERNANERERRATNAGGEAVASTHASSVPGFIPYSTISGLQDGWSGSMGRPRTISESERFRCDVSHSKSISRNDKNTEGFGEHKRHEQVGRSDCNLPDSDSQRELQQNGDIGDIREWPCNGGETVPDSNSRRGKSRWAECEELGRNPSSERDSRRSAEPRLGGVDDGVPAWLDRDWWRVEPDIPRVGKGIPDRVNRLKALGNAAVPAWAYPIFKSIVESDKEECKWVK